MQTPLTNTEWLQGLGGNWSGWLKLLYAKQKGHDAGSLQGIARDASVYYRGRFVKAGELASVTAVSDAHAIAKTLSVFDAEIFLTAYGLAGAAPESQSTPLNITQAKEALDGV